MPFGLSGTHASFQKMMDLVLYSVESFSAADIYDQILF